MKTKRVSIRNIIILICLVLISIINQPLLQEGFQRTVRGLFVSYAYIALAVFWSISALERVREKNSRRVMKGIVGMLLFWLVLRAVKYEVWNDSMSMAIWYLFYTPQTMLPLLVFYMTLYIDGTGKSKPFRLLMIPAGVIVLGILTNNIHQLAFCFEDGIADPHADYSYGPLYYISLIWMVVFMFGAIINAAAKTRLRSKKWATHALVVWMIVPILYFLYYLFGPFFLRTYFMNFPEAFCLIYIVFLEICLHSGLLISNENHKAIFDDASIMAEITDSTGTMAYRTKLCPYLSIEKKRLTDGSVLDQAYELHETEIPAGRVYWLNDVRELLKMNEDLKNIGEALAEENNILEAEINIMEQQTALEEQNHIYDCINEAIDDKKKQLLTLLENPKQLKRALITAAYMKRKGNLVILSRQNTRTDLRELGLCINESFSYLKLNGCLCSCTVNGERMVSAELLSGLYDVFEEVLEQSYEGVEAVLCIVKTNAESVMLRMEIEHCNEDFLNEIPIRDICKLYAIDFSSEREDEVLYLTFVAKEVSYE